MTHIYVNPLAAALVPSSGIGYRVHDSHPSWSKTVLSPHLLPITTRQSFLLSCGSSVSQVGTRALFCPSLLLVNLQSESGMPASSPQPEPPPPLYRAFWCSRYGIATAALCRGAHSGISLPQSGLSSYRVSAISHASCKPLPVRVWEGLT